MKNLWSLARPLSELTGGKGANITFEVAGGNGLNRSALPTKTAGVIAHRFLTGADQSAAVHAVDGLPVDERGTAVVPRSLSGLLVLLLAALLITTRKSERTQGESKQRQGMRFRNRIGASPEVRIGHLH